jgi:DNA-binding beta-propeller fold protein YncE
MLKSCMRNLAVWLFSLALTIGTVSGQTFRIVKRLPLGGEGGWDRLTIDSQSRRLYVPRGDRVQVLDLDHDQVVGEVNGTPGVHAVAVAQEFNRGFTSNGWENTVTIFDLQTLQVLIKVPVGQSPDAIVYDPVSKKVFVFNRSSRDATVLEAQSGKVEGTVALDGKTESAAADGQGTIYVNLKDKGEVIGLDTRKLEVTKRFSLKLGEKPTGLDVDPVHGRVFSGCRNRILTIVDTQTGNLIATVPIGAGVDGVVYNQASGTIFTANGWDGTLTVVQETQPGKFEVTETISTQRGARQVALDANTQSLYLPTAQLVFPNPPPASDEQPAKPQIVKGSFEILVVGR